MGYATRSIPFFVDTITIRPHTASYARHLDRPISIREFAEGEPVRLEQRDDNDEYIVSKGRYPNIAFIEGPEQ